MVRRFAIKTKCESDGFGKRRLESIPFQPGTGRGSWGVWGVGGVGGVSMAGLPGSQPHAPNLDVEIAVNLLP